MEGYSSIFLITIASIFVWIFPPIKQYKTDYFLFFVFMAVLGTGGYLLGMLTGVRSNNFYPASFLFLLYSLSSYKQKYFILAAAFMSLFIFPIIKPGDGWLMGIPALINLIMLIIMLSRIVTDLSNKQEVNLFKVLLFVYVSIDLMKQFVYAVMVAPGYKYYKIGVAAQVLFGIAFCFVNDKTKIFKVRVKEIN